jgi:hypothetical protein
MLLPAFFLLQTTEARSAEEDVRRWQHPWHDL